MKTTFSIIFCSLLIIALNCVKADQSNQLQLQKSVEDLNEHQQVISNEEARNRLMNILLANLDSSDSSDEPEEDEHGIDKRMTYRYGKRMTYRYGKRSAMPYRFGKRSSGHEVYPSAQQIIDYLRTHETGNDEIQNSKRMTYRYGRSVDKQ